jgi:hypothetical protein
MAPEGFLPILSEALGGRVDDDLVVGRLEGDEWLSGMYGGAVHGEHVGFCYEFYGDRDVVFPCSEGFVVGCGYEAAVFVAEC